VNDSNVTTLPTSCVNRVVASPLGVVTVVSVCVLYMAVMLWQTYDDPAGADQGLNAMIGH